MELEVLESRRRLWDMAAEKASRLAKRACQLVILPTVNAANAQGRNEVLIPAIRIDNPGTECAYLVDRAPYKDIIDYLDGMRLSASLLCIGETSFLQVSWSSNLAI